MKKMQRIIGVVLAVFVIAACNRVAYVQKDDTVDFSKIRTYAWVAGTQKDSTKNAPVKSNGNDLVDRKIRASINKNLQQNGWREVKGNPDVVLVYDVDIQKENRRVADPQYSMPTTRWFYNYYNGRYVPVYYPSQFMGYRDRTETVREGTITLTMMDAHKEKTIWQGWTSSEVNGRQMTDKEIEENVKAIVKKLG